MVVGRWGVIGLPSDSCQAADGLLTVAPMRANGGLASHMVRGAGDMLTVPTMMANGKTGFGTAAARSRRQRGMCGRGSSLVVRVLAVGIWCTPTGGSSRAA